MKSIEYYEGLPDFLGIEVLNQELELFFVDIIGIPDIEILDSLDQLAVRFSNCNGVLSDRNKALLIKKVLKLWDKNSIENTEFF